MKFFLIIFLFFLNQSIFSQELNSTVFINSDNIETSDKYIFEEMKVAFEQFLNNQKWTEDTYKNEEKIKCNFIINIVNLPSISNFRRQFKFFPLDLFLIHLMSQYYLIMEIKIGPLNMSLLNP